MIKVSDHVASFIHFLGGYPLDLCRRFSFFISLRDRAAASGSILLPLHRKGFFFLPPSVRLSLVTSRSFSVVFSSVRFYRWREAVSHPLRLLSELESCESRKVDGFSSTAISHAQKLDSFFSHLIRVGREKKKILVNARCLFSSTYTGKKNPRALLNLRIFIPRVTSVHSGESTIYSINSEDVDAFIRC